MSKIVWISDFDMRASGYFNISIALCTELAKRGHEIKASGLGYNGQEHFFPFSIIPSSNIKECVAVAQNLFELWKPDAVVVALDIPVQEQLLKMLGDKHPHYIGIMPVEADPLCISWAMVMMQTDKVFIISEFGTNEAKKVGVDAEHIQIGVDTSSWVKPTQEERANLRKFYGIADDEFVVLTVADNQERKHLSRSMEIFKDFSERVPKSRYMLVTREHNYVGWKLRDYAQELKITDKFHVFERGMSHKDLWSLYAISDAFLLTSKAEGLGIPLLEAMAVGVPCVATDCTAISEVLGNGERGFLIPPDYVYRDPFGNGARYFASRLDGLDLLLKAHDGVGVSDVVESARAYVEGRDWQISVEQMEKALEAAKR